MGRDFFNNLDNNNLKNSSDIADNFFLQQKEYTNQTEPVKRLNDYDFNILKEEAYKDVTDEVFKLEYKIAKAEEEINELDLQIQSAKDIRDFNLVESLFNRKKILQEELKELIEIYNTTSLSAKISGGITTKLRQKFNSSKKIVENWAEVIISKLPGNFSSFWELKKSLAKLENINKNVDELMTMQTPYGEGGDKYIQLSKYITRANTIQAEISKYLR